MQISLKSLTQFPNRQRPFEYSIDLSGEKVNTDFPFKEPVLIKGVITDRSGAVFFDANAQYTLTVHCSRCNKEFTVDKSQNIHFLLNTSEETDEATEGMFYLGSDIADTDEIIIPEIIMDMDMAYLCSEDCKGLCVVCGKDLNEGECGCERKNIHPQLAKLKELLENK